ncbi:hypothetical protein GQ44DRAFT_67569 [Phaeosphaeriaceae sp. PMI808]|nr:hypothetical protein GQ44DRAFT_67569 [Phaeosphaeriaceae sp. PMI808]
MHFISQQVLVQIDTRRPMCDHGLQIRNSKGRPLERLHEELSRCGRLVSHCAENVGSIGKDTKIQLATRWAGELAKQIMPSSRLHAIMHEIAGHVSLANLHIVSGLVMHVKGKVVGHSYHNRLPRHTVSARRNITVTFTTLTVLPRRFVVYRV